MAEYLWHWIKNKIPITMKNIKLGFIILIAATFIWSCAQVPFTGRSQARFIGESEINEMSFSQYDEFLKENKPTNNTKEAVMVKRVGNRIQKAAENYFTALGQAQYLNNYEWEFNLVNDPTVNAWCMPGGKVVVYSGIMDVAKDEDGLAVVMGHEIAHALANHGNERMSQGMLTQGLGTVLSEALSQKPSATRNLFLAAFGVGAQAGVLLPFSRKHESEADEIGLYLMAMAGYDSNAAAPFWERMAAKGGASPPEFMSTHPSPERRSATLKSLIPKAKEYAQRYPLER